MSPANSLGQEIRRLRMAHGVTLPELSRRSGVREAYLEEIEADRAEPSATALWRITQELELGAGAYERLTRFLSAPERHPSGDDSGYRVAPPIDRGSAWQGLVTSDSGVDSPRATADPTSGLQLDHAEFDDAPRRAGCAMCRAPLLDAYFQINGQVVCRRCCEQVQVQLHSGSGWSRAARAIGAGVIAAGAGTAVYYAVLTITGYELGLIAIVVGVMVGKAVNWGSRGRGGWKYQTLAMALTYLSIVTSYLPMMIGEVIKNPTSHSSAASPGARPGSGATATTADGAAGARPTTAASGLPANEPPLTLARGLLGIGALLFIACAMPFLAGITNVMGIIIIGIGVYEAWKFNRRHPVVITGPHALAASTPSTAGA
jgi:transcriptional regulator with XRE-family HTH domain